MLIITNRNRLRPGVRPDQVWQDTDRRYPHRYLRVLEVDDRADEVVVVPFTRSPERGQPAADCRIGARRVRRDRFATTRGYELVWDAA